MVETVVLGVNRHGERIYEWLLDREDADVLALITDESQYHTIEALDPELLISSGFRHVVPEEILEVPDLGAVNTHPSYLPYNRGANPNVWSIVDEHPAGVAIHYMTPSVDAGPIIARRMVPVRPDDTGKTLYERLERELVDLFKAAWTDIRNDTATTTPQEDGEGTYHYMSEFTDLFELDRSETVEVGKLIDRLRALTFPPYNNAYFEADGEKYYVDIDIRAASETESGEGLHWNVPDYSED